MELSYEKQLFDLQKVYKTEVAEMKQQRSSDVEELQENIRAVSLGCLDLCESNTFLNVSHGSKTKIGHLPYCKSGKA